MKYNIVPTSRFKKDLKRMVKRGCNLDKINLVISILANGEILPGIYHDHALSGELEGSRECHIEPDWLLIYEIVDDNLILFLTRTGTHSDLFD